MLCIITITNIDVTVCKQLATSCPKYLDIASNIFELSTSPCISPSSKSDMSSPENIPFVYSSMSSTNSFIPELFFIAIYRPI